MTSKILLFPENAITWRDAGSGGTYTFTPTTLGSLSGRQGAYGDLGSAARPRSYDWVAWCKPGSTRVVNEIVRVYLSVSYDNTIFSNDDGTGDIALSSVNKLLNVDRIGEIVIDENAAVTMAGHGSLWIAARYVAPIFYNQTANSLSSTASDYGFALWPTPDQLQ